MTFSITYYFNDKSVESNFRNEEQFAECHSVIENVIITDLRMGRGIEIQKGYWIEMLNQINEDWCKIVENSDEMRNFQMAIVILTKLKVSFEFSYGFFDTPTFKKIKRQFDIKSVRPCVVCKMTTTKKCSCCKKVYYCSKECQSCDWKNHKQNLKK